MKKNIFIIAAIFGILFGATSCQDMLETDSDRQIFDPALDQKTDSIFYTLGILKAVQQAADQYVLFNEMRGDLTATNHYTEKDLKKLATFSTEPNKYDSAYVFYRIINNCNYYIAHRDTTLLTGSRNVSKPEYAQALAIRAWAYIQLASIYGEVPFYTDPITSISQANEIPAKRSIRGICDALAPELAQFSGYEVPSYGNIDANNGKTIDSRDAMFPVDLVLGDLYLETGQYELAARSYFTYLKNHKLRANMYFFNPTYVRYSRGNIELPAEFPRTENDFFKGVSSYSAYSWTGTYSKAGGSSVITMIPMATSRIYGVTSDLPRLFGYNFYISTSRDDIYLLEREIDASEDYLNLCKAQDFYFVPRSNSNDNVVESTNVLGDVRRFGTLVEHEKGDSLFNEMYKYEGGNILIYRASKVYLRLAEAINRMGYPDAAFAILKDGLNRSVSTNDTYITPETQEMLRTTLPFFSDENLELFAEDNWGIHAYGNGHTRGEFSPYQFDAIVGDKISKLNEMFGLGIEKEVTVSKVMNEETGEEEDVETSAYKLEDLINAVEDLICDEYALELAFEGNRFSDLCRLARHKNEAGLYGANFGGIWLAKKLEHKSPQVDLTQQVNWYLHPVWNKDYWNSAAVYVDEEKLK